MGLVAAVWLVFGQTRQYGFVNYDDDVYVYRNPVVARGLTRDGVAWAFAGGHADNWHPLTWLSHMLDAQLFGLAPAGHHVTSVLLHALAAALLFLVLHAMTGTFWRSAFVAAAFAVHPLRAESVAWVSERKDVLSAVFCMLVLAAYLRYTRRPASLARYLVVAVLLALGLLAKPMLVTLPVVLLLLDYWPLGRFASVPVRRLLLEKAPLLALAAVSSLMTVRAQHLAIQPLEQFSLPHRLANAAVACVTYLGALLAPRGLAAFYPHESHAPAVVALALVLLALLTVIAVLLRRERPYVFVGWLWYLVMLAPVSGILQVGAQARADRFTYLPQIGLLVVLAWGVAELCGASRPRRVAASAVAAAWLVLIGVRAHAQAGTWRDSETLWRQALAVTERNGIAHGNLGAALLEAGRTEEAMAHLREALEIAPTHEEAHTNLANALVATGQVDEALVHYRRAQELDPTRADAAFNLGNGLLAAGRTEEAIAQFQAALAIAPDLARAHNNLGNALQQALALQKLERVAEAIAHYRTAVSCGRGTPTRTTTSPSRTWRRGRRARRSPNIDSPSRTHPGTPTCSTTWRSCWSRVPTRRCATPPKPSR